MKGATNYQEDGSLKNPVNQVVAVLPHNVDAQVVVRVLREAGVSSDSIGVLVGRRDAHKWDAASGKHGWVAKLAQIGPDLGDLDARHLRNYLKALEEDQTVIAVVREDGNRRRQVADLLKRFGAIYINSYGMFSIEGLALTT